MFPANVHAKRFMVVWKKEHTVSYKELLSPGRDNQGLHVGNESARAEQHALPRSCCTVGQEKKWLSLNYTGVYTSVVISTLKAEPSLQLQDWSFPSPTIWENKWNLPFVSCKCICRSKLDQRVRNRQSGECRDVSTRSNAGAWTVCSPRRSRA